MTFTVTGGEGLADRMAKVNFLPLIEREVIAGIRENTAHGMGANGVMMKPYAEATKKFRIARGLETSFVNLRVKTSDSLLDTLHAEKIDDNHSTITVAQEKELQAEGLSNNRQFMGVTSKAIILIENGLEQELISAIQ